MPKMLFFAPKPQSPEALCFGKEAPQKNLHSLGFLSADAYDCSLMLRSRIVQTSQCISEID